MRLSLRATYSILEAKPPPTSQKLSTPLPCHVKTELGVKVYPSCLLLELWKMTMKSLGKRRHCFAQTVVAHIVSHAATSAIRIQEGKVTVRNLSLRLIPKLRTPPVPGLWNLPTR